MRARGDGERPIAEAGFTLVEMLIALLILSSGLLASGQLVFVALSSASLARSKGNAALVAQDKLEFLADLYRRNPEAPELAEGNHEGAEVQIPNADEAILNRFSVTWVVRSVTDPRPGMTLKARHVRVTVIPIGANGSANNRVLLNKTVSVSSIISNQSP